MQYKTNQYWKAYLRYLYAQTSEYFRDERNNKTTQYKLSSMSLAPNMTSRSHLTIETASWTSEIDRLMGFSDEQHYTLVQEQYTAWCV